MPRWMYGLLIFTVLAAVLSFFKIPPLLLFVIAALGILPLAALIGQEVEKIAEYTGDKIGGLLFATFGNATELIIGIFALFGGLIDVVRASIIGSILGNLLLVLGVAVCVGGFKYGRLKFAARPASQYSSLFALCVGGLILPTVAELLATRNHQTLVFEHGVILSDFIAVVLLLGYVASILFSIFHFRDKPDPDEEEIDFVLGARSRAAISRLLNYRRHIVQHSAPGKSGVLQQIDSTVHAIVVHETEQGAPVPSSQLQNVLVGGKQAEMLSKKADTPELASVSTAPGKTEQEKPEVPANKSGLWIAIGLLAVVTAGVAWLSDILVGSIEPVTVALHWNPAFVGLVFVPLIGGLPEYFNTIGMTLDKRVDMVLSASAGSSIQLALLVAPILVLVSLFAPHRLDLVFSLIELAVLGLATFLFSEITKDGELVWLEGLLLILLYCIMAGTVFIFGA